MEKTLRIAGIGMNKNFIDDSPQSVKPQASSTFMFSRTELDLKDNDDENGFQSPKITSATSALSTTSSLGVIDLEKQSLLSEKDDSLSQRLHDSTRESENLLGEQPSLSFSRFKRRLDDMSISKNFNSDLPSANKNQNFSFNAVSNEGPTVSLKQNNLAKAKPVPSPSSTKMSLFSDVSNVSSPVFDSSFNCGNSAVKKLEADQMENRKEFGSLPVSPVNISLNSENSDEKERKFTDCIKAKCYSIDEISNVLRNKLNLDMKPGPPIMVNSVSTSHSRRISQESARTSFNLESQSRMSKAAPQSLFKSGYNLPSETDRYSRIEEKLNSITSQLPARDNFLFDLKNGSISSTLGNDTLEESRASSIASINQIAEALRRKSLMAEPKLAIEHLLSLGKTKSKFVPSLSPCPSSTKSIPSSVQTGASERTQNEFTPASSYANTPSTITCSANDLSVDSVTGKVHIRNVPYESTFTTARKLLESRMEDKVSNASEVLVPSKNESTYKKHFSLNKTVSLLDLSDDTESLHNEFWRLNVPAEANEAGALLSAVRDKMPHLSDDLLSVLKCGSTKSSTTTEPVRQISFSHNITSTEDFCDTFDGDNTSDIIHAGTLYLGTQVEVIIDMENPCREPLKYKMVLKSVLLNGEVNLLAVLVVLVSNHPDLILLPRTENEIKIMLSPLIQGKIDVILEFVSEEKRYSNITKQIRIIGENPKLKLEYPEKPEINFELLAESSVKNIPLLLKNCGHARLPLRFLIFEESRRTFFAKTVIEPDTSFECDVCVTTYDLPETQPSVQNISGTLMILLDTTEEASLGNSIILETLSLSAQVGRTSVVVNDNAPLTFSCGPLMKSSSNLINVTNSGTVPLDITVQTVEPGPSEFLVEPQVFQLLPRNTKSLKTVFKPLTKDRRRYMWCLRPRFFYREIDLHLIFNGTSKKYSTKIIGIVESDVVSSSMVTPLRHSPTTCVTPFSCSSDGSTGADGPMELDCTHNSISWGSVPLHTKNIQTITLRNRSTQKEKLMLSITDSIGAFRFIENKSCLRDLKLTLEPRESRKISVVFMPFVADQAMSGRILIMRRHSLEASVGELEKRIIPLYGIGGTAKIVFSGVFRDNDNRLWLTPEAESLETKFTVENAGDSVAFVKIISEDADDSVVPEEIVLLPAESAEVNYTVYLNKDRVDSLHKQNPSKEVLLANKITVFSGCESTRLRLKKLWTKYNEFDNIQRIRNKLELLMDMHSPSKVLVETISDSQFVLSNLWYEGVAEQVIGVLLPEQQLESACLDSTVVFKELAP